MAIFIMTEQKLDKQVLSPKLIKTKINSVSDERPN